MAQDERHEGRSLDPSEHEQRSAEPHREDARAHEGVAPDQQWRGGYGESSAGAPPRYTGTQPGYGSHGMGDGPQGGTQGGSWGVYGAPRDLAREDVADARSGPPQRFDQPHGRMPYGSSVDRVKPREPGGRGHSDASSAHGTAARPPETHARSGEARRRGPKGYQRSDERIGEVIYERLVDAHGIDPSDVTIEVKDGTVTLYGSVAHRQMKYWIEDIAADTFGVKDVVNKLRVALTAPWPMTSGRGVR